jgi:hypothetical protein
MTAADMAAGLSAAEAVRLIEAADGPADLFGDLGGADASRRYRRLARLTHPDARGRAPAGARGSPPRASAADRAFARLAELWAQHQGARGPLLVRGDIANFYPVRGGLLKLPRDPADNDLMDREAAALTQVRAGGEERFGAYFPRLVQAQRVRDKRSGVERHGNVMARLAGFASLAEVRAAFPGGLDPRDAAWMWRRLLVAIGAAHRAGVIHGAVLPEHVLIHPAEHGLVLVDWCYSSRLPGSRAGSCAVLPAIVGRYRDWYPPEVLAGGPAGPDADIWMATRCITELMGGRQPARIAAFAAGCMLANPSRRPPDAWRLLAELDELLERLYGPRAFRPFALP